MSNTLYMIVLAMSAASATLPVAHWIVFAS